MPHFSELPVDHLTVLLMDNLIHLVEVIPSWHGVGLPDHHLFSFDRNQFHAIHSQLQMLLSTQPIHPWAQSDWDYNFIWLLSQIIRQAKHYLNRFTSVSGYASPVYLENLAVFYGELSPYLSYARTLVKTSLPTIEGIY